MNRSALCYGLGLLAVTIGCSPKTVPRVTSSPSAKAATYNSYNEDLTSTRPTYTVVTQTASTKSTTSPISKADTPDVKSTNKPTIAPEPARRSDAPNEALYVNKKLDALLDTIAQQNRSVQYASGYRIQIYVGNERQEADAAKLQVYQSFPELSPYLSYKQPTYRLKVGDFMRRLDAEWYLSQLKQQFTSVILQPDKVDIRRSLSIK